MALCSSNPHNVTLTWVVNQLHSKTDLFYIDKPSGLMAGKFGIKGFIKNNQFNYQTNRQQGPYGDYVLKAGFLDEPE